MSIELETVFDAPTESMRESARSVVANFDDVVLASTRPTLV